MPARPLEEAECAPGLGVGYCEGARKALRRLLSGELLRHALHEGDKAVAKALAADLRDGAPLGLAAVLVFSPERVAELALREERVVLTDGAAVFVAAVAEYVMAEVLEVSGFEARRRGADFLEARHVARAMGLDAELSALFLGGRGGGRRGLVRGGSMGHTLSEPAPPQPSTHALDLLLLRRAAGMPGRILVDPRDGCHRMAASAAGPWLSVRELDAACELSASARRAVARACLSSHELGLLQHFMGTGAAAYSQTRVRQCAEEHASVLPTEAVHRLALRTVLEAGGRVRCLSHEALGLLREVLEWYAVDTCCAAAGLADQCGRRSAVAVEDLRAADSWGFIGPDDQRV